MITLASFSEANDNPTPPYDRLGASYFSGIGESFVPSQNLPWAGAGFYVAKVGSPTGNAYAKLYTAQDDGDGNYPVDLLATSDAIDVSTLGTSKAIKDFLASVGEQYVLDEATVYVVTLEYSGGDASNYIIFGFDGDDDYAGGNICVNNGGWFGSIEDLVFYVYGVESATPHDVTKTLAYTVKKSIGVTKGLEYRLVTEHEVTKPLNYQVGPILIDSYQDSNVNINAAYWEDGNNWYAINGQSFANVIELLAHSVKFYLKRVGNPTGNIYAVLTEHTGTYGTSSKGTATATSTGIENISNILAVSDPIAKSSISTTAGLIQFFFTLLNKVKLNPNTKYVVGLVSAGDDVSNHITFGIDTSSPTHAGNRTNLSEFAPGNPFGTYEWTSSSTVDIIFYFYGEIPAPKVDTTKTLAYSVVKENEVTKGLVYSALTEHEITKGLDYELILSDTIDVTKALAYTIKKSIDITKGNDYRVKNVIAQTKAIDYKIKIAVAVTKGIIYSLKTVLAITKTAEYRVKTVPKNITKTLAYRIKNTINNLDKALNYAIKTSIATTKDINYSIITDHDVTKQADYEIDNNVYTTYDSPMLYDDSRLTYGGETSSIDISLALAYAIKTSQAITKQLDYELQLERSVLKALVYAVIKSLGISKIAEYRVVKATGITKAVDYFVAKSHAVELPLQYNLSGFTVTIDKPLEYILSINPYCKKSGIYGDKDTPYTDKEDVYSDKSSPYSSFPKKC